MESTQFIEKIQNDKLYPLVNSWKKNFPQLYNQNDARILWFEGVVKMTNNLKLGYLSICHWEDQKSWRSSPSGLKNILDEFETFILWGYIHGLCIITEETTRLIWGALGKKETEDIREIYDGILALTQLRGYSNLFKIFQFLRNMTHTNGFHNPRRGTNAQIPWRDKIYDFILDRGVDFVSVRFLVEVLTLDLCEAMNKIMMNASIQSVPLIKRRIRV